MEFVVVGRPDGGGTLRLDYRAFAYAGKFVIGAPGTAALYTEDGSPAAPEWTPETTLPASVDPEAFARDVLAAVSFSPDRTDPECCRLRYVTVHAARRGEGLGPRLITRTVAWLAAAGYERIRIAVNNPFAYEALYKCGFAYTGETTGIAELELERSAARPADEHGDAERYRSGLRTFRDRDEELSDAERRFLDDRLGGESGADTGGGDESVHKSRVGPPEIVERG
ncbi:GNAT superfamily N-acetyltransferase [Halorubrum alkaliphilum]|uniref:GNAT superfamily N-acetyltransferase n=1 Tax=Halorubrum alkaliphilum TaxID=261290 RepID=A0A8T4GCG6_9EURY|nr:GNAT family N-acetyltransferase [Halorubrum alkaliphilum]MBP1921497.1 GNAT superfamily N-acetyltransferase [Halorubrum alkaliphilum]